jgi:GNAT superfamily N-acetyltransferase
MRVIRATIEHLDMVLPLFGGYREFYQRPRDPDRSREFLASRLTQLDSAILLAVDGRNDEIGAGFVQLYPVFSSLRLTRAWILNDLFVAQEYRRKGVARDLLDASANVARKTGAPYLELATANDNAAARTLYESLGWVRDEEFLHYTLEVT